MGLRVNTNVSSLKAQNALKRTTARLEQSLNRLSSGLRINTGRDNVVGLVKSEELRSQIRGIDVALTNISNSNSFMNVAEGYLSQLTDITQNMREIAVQAAESTISSANRNTLSTQFSTLLEEYDRLSQKANFTGVSLLDGSFTNRTLQIGASEGETLTISIDDARSASIGQVAKFTTLTKTAVSGEATATADFTDPAATLSFNVDGTDYVVNAGDYADDGVSSVDADESALAYVNAINRASGSSGITATVNANIFTVAYGAGAGLESNQNIIINGVTVKDTSLAIAAADDTGAATLVSLINTKSASTGVEASIDTANNTIQLTASDGRNINIRFSDNGDVGSTYNIFGITGGATNTQTTQRGTFDLVCENAFTITDTGSNISDSSEAVSIDTTTALAYADLSSTTNAQTAMSIMDQVVTQIQSLRATVGSTAERLDIAVAELQSRQENLYASESEIRDADIAVETARLTQDQILQQAGVAVLSQANAAPQIAIALLSNLG
ncbi:MAG: hypothetical protein HQM16_03370 [Deltaproteobacteria bacterium]|nr:hypothetical protein [Deltaproteobacteria bacterium]